MKSHHWLLWALLRDCGVQCRVPPTEIERDMRTIIGRLEHEGDAFMAITLPSLWDAITSGFRDGVFPSTASAFARSGGLPKFLRGFLRNVFWLDGSLRDDPCVTTVACLNQICNLAKKVELECSEKRTRAAFTQFIATDASIPDEPPSKVGARLVENPAFGTFKVPDVETLATIYQWCLGDVLLPLDRKIFEGEALPARHGKGATAQRIRHNAKYADMQWTERLDEVFSPDLYVHAFERETDSGPLTVPSYSISPLEGEIPVRVISVPKTLKAPRIIAIEPVVMQYMQQGLMAEMVGAIGASSLKRSIGFTDQRINGSKALEGSLDGNIATLDLSEASDRVPLWLAKRVISPTHHNLWRALDATRSRRAAIPTGRAAPGHGSDVHSDGCNTRAPGSGVGPNLGSSPVPEAPRPYGRGLGCPPQQGQCGDCTAVYHRRPDVGCPSAGDVLVRGDLAYARPPRASAGLSRASEVLELRKFASMGSAVCFPVEAMLFFCIALMGVHARSGLPFTRAVIRRLADTVHVYGDDIIVPTDSARCVAVFLEAYGLKVNARKSFWTGKFRESCGVEAFDGSVITPARLRSLDWNTAGSADWLASWVEFSNALYFAGFWETSRAVRKKLNTFSRIPMASMTSPAVAYHNVRDTHDVQGWDPNLHRWMVRAHVVRPVSESSPLDGTAALRKTLMGRMSHQSRLKELIDPDIRDPRHLLQATRSSSVSTKTRWVQAY